MNRFRRALAFPVVAAVLLSACGGDTPEDYTIETRDNFLVACTDPLVDSILITELCECTFESAQSRLQFERFVDIERRFESNLNADLGIAMDDILADCILREADL